MSIGAGSQANEIDVAYERARRALMIRDSQPITTINNYGDRDQLCTAISAFRVLCTTPRSTKVEVYAGGGDDDVRVSAARSSFDGDLGDDMFRGTSGRDSASGGRGKDVLRTGAGNDSVDGGGGADRSAAGGGKDRITARDGRRDRRISCGGGKQDHALVDRRKDPRTRGCEKVRWHRK